MKKIWICMNLWFLFFFVGCKNQQETPTPEVFETEENIVTILPDKPEEENNQTNSLPAVPIVALDTNLLKAKNFIFVNVLSQKTLHLPSAVLGYAITWDYDGNYFIEKDNILTSKKNGTTTLVARMSKNITTARVEFKITMLNNQIISSEQYGLLINYAFISNSKKIGGKQTPSIIVVHNTANSASAKNEVNYLASSANTTSTSYHFVVDESMIYQAIPTNYTAYHAGNLAINQKSIGVEIAKSTLSNTKIKDAAIANAQTLISLLKTYYYINMNQIITHKDASGKHCPHDILDRYGLSRFYQEIMDKLENAK